MMRLPQLALSLLFGTAALWAQGSGSAGPPASTGEPFPERPFEVTRTASGSLGRIEPGFLILDDEKQNEPRKLKLTSKVRITADKKSALAGRKKLTVDDLTAGLPLKVTYRPDNNEVIEIRVLKPKAV